MENRGRRDTIISRNIYSTVKENTAADRKKKKKMKAKDGYFRYMTLLRAVKQRFFICIYCQPEITISFSRE